MLSEIQVEIEQIWPTNFKAKSSVPTTQSGNLKRVLIGIAKPKLIKKYIFLFRSDESLLSSSICHFIQAQVQQLLENIQGGPKKSL